MESTIDGTIDLLTGELKLKNCPGSSSLEAFSRCRAWMLQTSSEAKATAYIFEKIWTFEPTDQ